MTYEELKELKNDTTIVITYPSGRTGVALFKKEFLKETTNVLQVHYMFVSPDCIRLATKEDIDLYILNERRELDQLEKELKAGL